MTSREIEYSLDTKDMNPYFIKKGDLLGKTFEFGLALFP
jgi:hypothetical protein